MTDCSGLLALRGAGPHPAGTCDDVLVLVCDSERQPWPPDCSSALEKTPERLGAGGGWTSWLSSGGTGPGRLQHMPASSARLPGDASFDLLEVGGLGPVCIGVLGVS